MSTAVEANPNRGAVPGLLRGVWDRRLDAYPENGPRTFYLGIVVLATIVLYYELYVQGAVAPTVLATYHMSFTFFVYISVVGNALGAFSSLIAGLADRWGRANLVAWGVGVTAVMIYFLPEMGDKWSYSILFSGIAFVEGIILVATPALVRDFSPQLGRASAMGFWTLGPVIGSLVVSEVSSHTLNLAATNWQDLYRYAALAGIIVFVVALFGLRELAPSLRDQLMVSMRDRALIEARAKGIDIEESLKHPWRQMLKKDVVGSAFAISIFLMIYYAAVGFFVIYFTAVFGWSSAKANGLGNWFWAFDAGALIVVGILSDLVRVRKPFMVIGAVGAIVMTAIFATKAHQPHTSYYEFVLIISLLAVFLAIAYAPWMASFTETVEKRNPALTATGLAVWGWIIRIVVALSAIFLPIVVTAVTPLVDHGTPVAVAAASPAGKTLLSIDPATLAALQKNPLDQAADAKAIGEIMAAQHVGQAQAIQNLQQLATPAGQAQIAPLVKYGAKVQQATKDAPDQFETWWWVCLGCEVAFIPFVFIMAGRWSPRKAREDAEAHERLVQQELAALQPVG
jgi:MFS family permease